MRISDLSRETDVPVPTIKYYLREGLLPQGVATAPNQAEYDDAHVRRLRLLRVLVEVGALSLDAVRRVAAALDETRRPLHDVLGMAHHALPSPHRASGADVAAARRECDAWLRARGWDVKRQAPARDELAAALAALRRLGWQVGPEAFEPYATHAEALARTEIEHVAAASDRTAAVEEAVIGTVVFERALTALRRLAQEHHSRRLLARKR